MIFQSGSLLSSLLRNDKSWILTLLNNEQGCAELSTLAQIHCSHNKEGSFRIQNIEISKPSKFTFTRNCQ